MKRLHEVRPRLGIVRQGLHGAPGKPRAKMGVIERAVDRNVALADSGHVSVVPEAFLYLPVGPLALRETAPPSEHAGETMIPLGVALADLKAGRSETAIS